MRGELQQQGILMKKRLLNKFILLTATGALLVSGFGKNIFIKEVRAFTARNGTVDVASLNVRTNAGMGNNTIATLSRNTSVKVLDEVNEGGMYWYKISFNDGSGDKEGFVAKSYIKTASTTTYTVDNDFESEIAGFPESYKDRLRALHSEYPNWKFIVKNVDIPWNEVIENESVVGRNLVSRTAKSSWKSTARGAYNWDNKSWPGFDSNQWVAAGEEIIRYYMDPRNFLDSTNIFQFLHHGYTTGEQTAEGVEKMLKGTFMESKSTASAAVTATTNVVNQTEQTALIEDTIADDSIKYEAPKREPYHDSDPAMDDSVVLEAPKLERDSSIIQADSGENPGPGYTQPVSTSQDDVTTEFNDVDHGPGIENNEAIKESLTSGEVTSTEVENSIGPSLANPKDSTYVDMIMEAARSSGVNPYVIAAMLIQEQGVKGTSELISGAGGVYNFFNIEAYQSGNQSATDRGLAWAGSGNTYMRPWNTKAKAITGGAMYYGNNYVKAGQDSFYFKKFNVLGANRYKHQYMTNIEGAKNEGARLSMAYSEEDKKGQFTFYIPVYLNMPSSPEQMPSGDGSPNNRLSSLSVDGYTITPAFGKENYSYTLELPANVSSINVNATAADRTATLSGSGNVKIEDGQSNVDVIVTAQNGNKVKYSINIRR